MVAQWRMKMEHACLYLYIEQSHSFGNDYSLDHCSDRVVILVICKWGSTYDKGRLVSF